MHTQAATGNAQVAGTVGSQVAGPLLPRAAQVPCELLPRVGTALAVGLGHPLASLLLPSATHEHRRSRAVFVVPGFVRHERSVGKDGPVPRHCIPVNAGPVLDILEKPALVVPSVAGEIADVAARVGRWSRA
jgi:hypothetical protein